MNSNCNRVCKYCEGGVIMLIARFDLAQQEEERNKPEMSRNVKSDMQT